jgi:thymidine kinase
MRAVGAEGPRDVLRLADGYGLPAPFTGETVHVGGLDSYEARCGGCYRPGTSDAALADAQ